MLTGLILIYALVAEPMPAESFLSGPVTKLQGTFQFTEGPVMIPGQGLLFSDIPGDTLYVFETPKSEPKVFRKPVGHSNGNVLDREKRLITCEHGNRRVTRTDQAGIITVIADQFLDRKFNSPNDICVRSDGVLFFTDPPYGLENRPAELPFCGVYAVFPDKRITLLSVYFKHPNGIALSPDEKTLYVGDSLENFVQAFELDADGTLRNTRLLCKVPVPDGLRTDKTGNIWIATKTGVQIFRSDGTHIETITLPETPSNLCFSDEGSTVYVTAVTGVYTFKIRTR